MDIKKNQLSKILTFDFLFTFTYIYAKSSQTQLNDDQDGRDALAGEFNPVSGRDKPAR